MERFKPRLFGKKKPVFVKVVVKLVVNQLFENPVVRIMLEFSKQFCETDPEELSLSLSFVKIF